jgi:hypothetical protein
VKWRCEWCGKPHAENDPPCDNCGHGEFEKAVVPAAPEADETTSDAYGYVWVCEECGNDHPKNTPPCDRCGHNQFERQPIEFDEEAVMAEMLGRSENDSRTSSADIGYLDVIDTRLALMMVGVAALVALLALSYLGIVSVPGIDIGPTGPVDAPGNATTYEGLSLSTVEAEYLLALNERRADEGYDAYEADDGLGTLAERLNKQRVAAAYGDADEPDIQRLINGADLNCERVGVRQVMVPVSRLDSGSLGSYETESAAASALVESQLAAENGRTGFMDVTSNRGGVDVHVAPDDAVYIVIAGC